MPSSALMAPMTRRFVNDWERYAQREGVDLIRFERGEWRTQAGTFKSRRSAFAPRHFGPGCGANVSGIEGVPPSHEGKMPSIPVLPPAAPRPCRLPKSPANARMNAGRAAHIRYDLSILQAEFA